MALALFLGATAQTFVPDVRLRQKLNAWRAGLVQADGYLSPQASQPGLPLQIFLTVDWSPADLTGLEGVSILHLFVTFDQGVELTWDSVGTYTTTLMLTDYPDAPLPTIPAATQLHLRRGNMSSIPPLPETLRFFTLEDPAALAEPPVIPANIYDVTLLGYPLALPWPELPTATYELRIERSERTELPIIPAGLGVLRLDSMPELQALPYLSEAVRTVYLRAVGLEHADMQSWLLHLMDMPLLQSVQARAVTHFEVGNCPLLSEVSVQLDPAPEMASSNTVFIIDAPALDSVSVVGEYGAVELTGTNIGHWPAFSPHLFSLVIRRSPFVQLPALPDALGFLTLANCPIGDIAALPGRLQSLKIEGTDLKCLPRLPDSLSQLEVVDSWVNCIPNKPVILTTDLSVCHILISSCPDASPYVRGRVFVDVDGNGHFSRGDVPAANITVMAQPGNYMTATNSDGYYMMGLPPGGFALTAEPGDLPLLESVSPEAHDIVLNAGDIGLDALDFALVVGGLGTDLHVEATTGVVRPGFEHQVRVRAGNRGLLTERGVEVRYRPDPQLLFVSGDHAPVVDGTDLVWTFDSMVFSQQLEWNVRFQLNAATPLGTRLRDTLWIGPMVLDVDTTNNLFALSSRVVGSYDPNDKHVTPEAPLVEEVANGVRLKYRIRFQNTGTYLAERVVITDTLDARLKWSTFRFDGASHASTWYMAEGVVHFVFDGIMLPDSTSDEPGSHGHVFFSIDLDETLPVDTEVPNVANIYFDFNEPVITDPAVLRVSLPTALHTLSAADGIFCYPVPTSDRLMVDLGDDVWGADIAVLDARGAVVLGVRATGALTAIDLRSLAPGAYLVRAVAAGTVRVQRIVKR